MSINNYDIVSQFMPGQPKGPLLLGDRDMFLYTELLDRTKRVGNNGVRIVKTFFHRDIADFEKHFELMKKICDALKVRAYTRLAPRSFRKVAHVHARLVVDALISENHAGVKTLYPSACGQVTPEKKLWLWDVDEQSDSTVLFEHWLAVQKLLKATVPSKKGLHFVSDPFDLRRWSSTQSRESLQFEGVAGMSLHKDNAVNLYIPDDAA